MAGEIIRFATAATAVVPQGLKNLFFDLAGPILNI